MTDDERIINEKWPLIRETYNEMRQIVEYMGYMPYVQRRDVGGQMDFWLTLKRMREFADSEIERMAFEKKAGL